MSTVSIKLVVADEIRRISIPSSTPFEGLLETVSTILPNCSPSLQFVDDEADVCSITNTPELKEALALSSQVCKHALSCLTSSGWKSSETPCFTEYSRSCSSQGGYQEESFLFQGSHFFSPFLLVLPSMSLCSKWKHRLCHRLPR